jgi:hypothetical protein
MWHLSLSDLENDYVQFWQMLFFPKFEFSNVFAIEMPEQMTLNTWDKILNS